MQGSRVCSSAELEDLPESDDSLVKCSSTSSRQNDCELILTSVRGFMMQIAVSCVACNVLHENFREILSTSQTYIERLDDALK